ncbi:fimbria/pilus periplasmic chaperone [Lonsdalea britannica]|uniref:fimbria/pilus periplasmic chaperone n=1 Tax=Lonsdalea britannica TaxID=1082704 RepID=UPI000E57888E
MTRRPHWGLRHLLQNRRGKTLRIMYVGAPLPEGRESVYWMNLEAITAVDKDSIQNKSVLQLAVLSRIKMLVRPGGAAFKSSSRFADDHESHALFRHAGQFHDGCEKTA